MTTLTATYTSDADRLYYVTLVASLYAPTQAERDAAAAELPALKARRNAAVR